MNTSSPALRRYAATSRSTTSLLLSSRSTPEELRTCGRTITQGLLIILNPSLQQSQHLAHVHKSSYNLLQLRRQRRGAERAEEGALRRTNGRYNDRLVQEDWSCDFCQYTLTRAVPRTERLGLTRLETHGISVEHHLLTFGRNRVV